MLRHALSLRTVCTRVLRLWMQVLFLYGVTDFAVLIRSPAPPLTGSPQGDHQQNDPAVTAAGSLRFYAEIRGFFASPNFDGVETTGRARHPSPPEKARIGAKGSKPRDDPQPRPVLRNPVKHGTSAILNDREVLAKMPGGSGMKNLTIASPGSTSSYPTPRTRVQGSRR